MSISIRTLKIVIGILVLVSMILSMVPMFGMAPVGRAMARQAVKPKPMPRIGMAPLSVAPRTSYTPQAVARPSYVPQVVPRYNVGSYGGNFAPLGVAGMPKFPEAPKPIVITPPALFGSSVVGEFATVPATPVKKAEPIAEVSAVFSPEIAEVMSPSASTAAEPAQGIPTEQETVSTIEPIPAIQLPATALLPGSSVRPIKPIPVAAEPAQIPEVQEEVPAIEVGNAIEYQPQTGLVTSTPANTHELIEQRAEAVHVAPVVDAIKSQQGTVKAGQVIDVPFKIERVEVEPAIAFEQGAVRVPRGELGRMIQAEHEKAVEQQAEEPLVQQAHVIEQRAAAPVIPQGVLKPAGVIEAPVALQRVEQPQPTVAVEQRNAVVPEAAGKIKAQEKPAAEVIKQEQTKAPVVEQAQAGRVVNNAAAQEEATVTVAPLKHQAPKPEERREQVALSLVGPLLANEPAAPAEQPAQGAVGVPGDQRPIVVPAPHPVPAPDGAQINCPPAGNERRPRVYRPVPGPGTPPRGPQDGLPEGIRNPRGEDHGGGIRGPRRPRPAGPIVIPGPMIQCPVYPPIRPLPPIGPELEPQQVASDGGGVGPVPFPPAPRPRVVNGDGAQGLPPVRGVRRSPLDDLEKYVIRDKQQLYGKRFHKKNAGASMVEQALPSLSLPSSLKQSAQNFINIYNASKTKDLEEDKTAYDEFVDTYNDIMDAIKREREAAQ